MKKQLAMLLASSIIFGVGLTACAPQDKSAKRTVITVQKELASLENGGLGGGVEIDGITYTSSAQGYALTGEKSETVTFDGYGYAFADGVMGTEYYVEGEFDTTEISYEPGKGIVGLLVVHGGNETQTLARDKKMIVALHEQNVLVFQNVGWSTAGTALFTNWTQFFTDEELQTLDRTSVKLGVLRSENNEFSFFVNDRYVGGRSYDSEKTLSGESYGKSGIGVAAVADVNGILESVSNFKYTQNEGTMSAIKRKLPKEKSMDLYLIAGQSNAAGSSKWYKEVMMPISDKTVYGNACVWYKGNPGSDIWTLARAGQGSSESLMGAEVGMSTVLQNYIEKTGDRESYAYDAAAGRYAGILKRAVGGTSLFNNTTGLNALQGNWYPPTNAHKNGYDYSETSLTGGLYRKFVADTVAAVAELKAMGFSKINVKGVFWMQGEADRANYHTYQYVFQNFVNDLRGEFNEKITPMNGQDFSKMPIFVGEISETFDSAVSTMLDFNLRFIQMQRKLPTLIKHVVVLDTHGFALNALDEDGNNIVVGSDKYHWEQTDMYEIGKIVGDAMVSYVEQPSA
ncbi:MAG: hypothetical protein J6D30_02100 [Clostridia bacterium]|nr:hypothetical protein [Clostridia bacterium]